MFKGDYKLIEYVGYPEYEKTHELYNLRDDPEEMDDLSEKNKPIASEMRSTLKSKLASVSK